MDRDAFSKRALFGAGDVTSSPVAVPYPQFGASVIGTLKKVAEALLLQPDVAGAATELIVDVLRNGRPESSTNDSSLGSSTAPAFDSLCHAPREV